MLQLFPPLFWAVLFGVKKEENRNRSAAEPERSGDSQRQMAEHSVLNIEANGRGWKEDATPLGLGIMGYDVPG